MPEKLIETDRAQVWQGDSLERSTLNAINPSGDSFIDALIFDSPFSEKTHEGHASGKLTADRAATFAKSDTALQGNKKAIRAYAARKSEAGESGRNDLEYSSFGESEIQRFCDVWLPATKGWVVSITDHLLAPIWSQYFSDSGLYCFSPLPLVETGSRVRMSGDGPACWTCQIVIARPRGAPYSKWGALPGAYVQSGERAMNSKDGTSRITGGKPLKSMMAIVKDYSRPGDLVGDPFLGGGTTLLAATRTGRRGIGIEMDPGRAQQCAEMVTAELHNTTRAASKRGQRSLF